METDDDIMSAEEFFGEINGGKKTPRKCRSRGKKPEALFAAVKVKMVMRIYGVSRAKALEIIAKREGEKKAEASEDIEREEPGRLMSAEEFFGALD